MITLVTGGQRSGKSKFAEQLALRHCANPVYIATAHIWDDEFRRRVDIHKQRRGPEWTTIEETLHVGDLSIPAGATVLLDCLTLLSTNWLMECDNDTDVAFQRISEELRKLLGNNADFILVTNEIGLGGISENALQRKFTDLQGSVNTLTASLADNVYFSVSGIPVKIK